MVSQSGKLGASEQIGVGELYGESVQEDSQGVSVSDSGQSAGGYVGFNPHVSALAAVERGAVEARYLSNGPRIYVDGLPGVEPIQASTCFHRVCAALGVLVPSAACRVVDLREDVLLELQELSSYAKLYYEYSGEQNRGNHISLVSPSVKSARIELLAPDASHRVQPTLEPKTVGVTNLVQFFNKSNMFSHIMFFSGEGDQDGQFGGDLLHPESTGLSFAEGGYRVGRPAASGASERPPAGSGDRVARPEVSGAREQSVSDPDSRHGQANLTAGVVRPRRRVVASKSRFNPTGSVVKSYVASSGVRFNNLNEIFLDAISREYAQDILEEVFAQWQIDMAQPDAVKFAEDLVWGFVIATTASNKADYHREFDVPHKGGSVVVSFDTFSRVLAEGHGVTRRQFARGVADDMHRFLLQPENLHLLPRIADRVGCDPQMATLAFDGSTHCTGLTSAQLSFAKLLERRNLFEDDSLLAEGASQRLMQGMSSGPRSIISR